MKKKRKKFIERTWWCERCCQWMVHDQRCPDTPKATGVKKWEECCCTIHTCYDAKKAGVKRSKKNAPVYRDFVPEAY